MSERLRLFVWSVVLFCELTMVVVVIVVVVNTPGLIRWDLTP